MVYFLPLVANVGVVVIQTKRYYTTSCRVFLGVMSIGILGLASTQVYSQDSEWIQACVWDKRLRDKAFQDQAEVCLGWQTNSTRSLCQGSYYPLPLYPLSDPNAIELKADDVSFHPTGQSDLQGHVQVQQNQSMITARTAQVFRNATTHQIDRVELDSNVHFMEPGRLMIAKHATLNP
ncbi:MAG: LptA/OstA family protein [Gammaproteobacteria bacterium]